MDNSTFIRVAFRNRYSNYYCPISSFNNRTISRLLLQPIMA